MAKVVVCGGGVGGLLTAMLLAADGHEVVVAERDAAPPPPPSDAWEEWERRGVNQFRLPHFLLPRFCETVTSELPEIIDGLIEAGAYTFNFFGPMRDRVPGGEHLDVVTARRPVLEAVVAAVADATPRVEVRRGVALAGLVTGAAARGGAPHVVGVRTVDGEVIPADLVIVATGRRTSLPDWLAAIGARPPVQQVEDSGFVYYGRHVASSDGSPVVTGPMNVLCGSLSLLALPADNGTCGLGIIASSKDAAMRQLRHEGPWEAVMRSLPGGALLLDATPISPLVTMAALEDRWSRYVVDGEPVVTGVLAVGDSWAATNPTLGRGISLALLHAVALRDVLRKVGDDPLALALAFDDVTETELTPWYASTVWHDRHNLAAIEASVLGRDEAPAIDPTWTAFRRLQRLVATDMEVAARFALGTAALRERPEEIVRDPVIAAKLESFDAAAPVPGIPDRTRLLELIAT